MTADHQHPALQRQAATLASPSMLGREPAGDELILQWWTDTRGERGDMITPAIRGAYVREVAHPAMIAQFDAHLAQLLTPAEWAFIVSRLRDRIRPDAQEPLTGGDGIEGDRSS